MQIKFAVTLLIATLLMFPSSTQAQAGQLASEIPGVVQLTHAIDAKKLTLGATIEMRLIHSVRVTNGTELPSGTSLNATVVQDDMQAVGKIKIALRFTEARMKDGKTIPIKATLLAINSLAMPVSGNSSIIEPAMEIPSNLNNQSDHVHAVDVGSGINLLSDASSQNSGVLVTTKNDIKLPRGTKMELALAPGL